MKTPPTVQAVDRVVALKMKAVDKLLKELIEPLADVGNPEKLIGKPYEKWNKDDFRSLSQIYGAKEPNPLSDFLFKKIYDRVTNLEAEVR